MISAKDLDYHTPPDAGHTWAETYFFPIAIPEHHLLATVYVVVRPGIGVMVNDVAIYGALSESRDDLLYQDAQHHLPAPGQWADIDSPTGLKIKAVRPPRDYRIDYVGFDDTEIHVDWIGMMEPFDIHDPAHSPKAAREKELQHAGSGLGAAWGGHFDMTGRVTGTVKVRGREFKVDSIERMDHSWGHRTAIKFNAQNSNSAAFEGGPAFHVITVMDLDAPIGREHKLAHGYVLEDGKVYGLTEGELINTRMGMAVVAMEMRLTDVRGKLFQLYGMADVGAPWNAYAGTVTWTAQMKWLMEGQKGTGYGCIMETIPLPALHRRRGRWFTDWPASGIAG
jgi:hypothetical protein